ncbi:MAG: sulfurtransferase TusC [Methylococcaceae bacterium]|nr:MAG: sulfurtransferase TusC [Methylococcaceae bacterium]
MNGKRFLFVLRRFPIGGPQALEALDAALTAAAFDQPVRLLFLDDGVWQLKRGQPAASGRSPMALLGSLALYDIAAPPWVERESLEERGLTPQELTIEVTVLARDRVAALLDDCDVLLNL